LRLIGPKTVTSTHSDQIPYIVNGTLHLKPFGGSALVSVSFAVSLALQVVGKLWLQLEKLEKVGLVFRLEKLEKVGHSYW
jgi:hypothetical protein